MTNLQLELTKLIGSKELSFGCLVKTFRGIGEFIEFSFPTGKNNFFSCHIKNVAYHIPIGGDEYIINENIIGHPATLEDLHKWVYEKDLYFVTVKGGITFSDAEGWNLETILFDARIKLFDQPDDVLKKIIDFIKANQ